MFHKQKVQACMSVSVQNFAHERSREGSIPKIAATSCAFTPTRSHAHTLTRLHTFTPTHRKAQAVLLATLIMFVVAAVGAGFILFVQSSMNLSQRSREEQEALLLAQAGLAFADQQLTEKGADWRPSILVSFDEFERSRGWHRPDKTNDWYGKYSARQVVDLLGNVAGSGSFLLKVKYLPDLQVFKIISIGRPKPNSPVYRRLIAYKPIPADWIWVTAENEGSPDPLLLDANGDNILDTLSGQAINWQVGQWTPPNNQPQPFWFNAERDPNQPIVIPSNEPQRLQWLRLRTWLGSGRLPIWDRLTNFTSTIRTNSDLLWYGSNALQMTDFFAASQTVLEVARTIQHLDTQTQVLVYDWQEVFQGFAVPSDFGAPAGSGFAFFPVGGVPRYMDGWERIGGLMPVRWVFNFPRRTEPRPAPTINLSIYYAQTRDANPPYSQNGYYRVPDPLQGQTPVLDNDQSDDNALFPTFGFYVLNYYDPNNPSFLAFRGIYIDNNSDQQFTAVPPADAPSGAFNDRNGSYRPELAQLYDWTVKPPQVDPNNPTQLQLRRQQSDSGWLQNDALNSASERNVMELTALDSNGLPQPLPFNRRFTAHHLYVPPGVEVRFDVYRVSQTLVLQRTWLIRHDGQPFRSPLGVPLPPPNNNRLVFIDPVPLAQFDADNDGSPNEDLINFRDDDGDGKVDEDPPQTAFVDNRMPTIVLLAEGNIRVSGQVAVSVKIVTPETIYIEGQLYPVTANATIELLAERNICVNFASGRTPIPSLDGMNPETDRAFLVPQFRIAQIVDPQNQLQGTHYLLPNASNQTLPFSLFADLFGGSIGAVQFPAPVDNNGDQVVDAADPQGRSPSVIYALEMPSTLPLSNDLMVNLNRLQNRQWTLRLVLLNRGWHSDDSNNPVRNPWTNLQVDIWVDSNGNGQSDLGETTRLYGPAEPMRTFPVASRWYQGDGRQVDLADPTTTKEWNILDIPIPLNALGSPQDVNALARALQSLRIIITSPVAGEVIPHGRTPVRYELAGIKLALYDENGLPRPIWQPTQSWFVLAQTVHAENGTIGIVPPPYFDPTSHPSWQQLIASTDSNWQNSFRQWQRLWSLYYLRHNSVRWTPFLDPSDPNLTLPQSLRTQLLAQSIPIVAGQLIMRVTPQTMLWRLVAQNAIPTTDPLKAEKDNALSFAWELGLDKAALPYPKRLDRDPATNLQQPLQLSDVQNLVNGLPFAEMPRAMFASAWLWVWRAATPQGVLDVAGVLLPNHFYRAPVVPNLNLPKGYAVVLQQQVGED